MDHLAISVHDQERSRGFYERYCGFGARPPRRYADNVLMLYDSRGFALALGPARDPIARPDWMHFGSGIALVGKRRSSSVVGDRQVRTRPRYVLVNGKSI